MESTQRSSGLRARTRGVRLGRAPNSFGAGVNLGPFRPPPAAARASQIRCPSFSTLRLSCALPFRIYLVGAAPCGGPRADEDIRPYGGVWIPSAYRTKNRAGERSRPVSAQYFRFSQNSALPTVRGCSSTSRMLLMPVRYMTIRSKPRP